MARDVGSAPARRDFHYNRWQLAKYAAGSSGFVLLGAFVVYWTVAPGGVLAALLALPVAAVGLVTVAFFGMLLVTAVGGFFNRAPVVSITAESIYDRRWGGPAVPWSDVREIAGVLVDSMGELVTTGVIAIVVDDPSRYYRPRGLYARFTYGLMRNPLFFNMVALDGTERDLIADFAARVPDKIAREDPIGR
jgi:hypothetical protein